MKILLRSHPHDCPSRRPQNAGRTQATIELRSWSSGFPRAESACARWERTPAEPRRRWGAFGSCRGSLEGGRAAEDLRPRAGKQFVACGHREAFRDRGPLRLGVRGRRRPCGACEPAEPWIPDTLRHLLLLSIHRARF